MTLIRTPVIWRGGLQRHRQPQRPRQRQRDRKWRQSLQILGKRRSHFRVHAQDIFHIRSGNVLTSVPSTPSSGHILNRLQAQKLSEFAFQTLLKKLSPPGFEPLSTRFKSATLPLVYRALCKFILPYAYLMPRTFRSLCSSSRGRVGICPGQCQNLIILSKSPFLLYHSID